MEVVKSYSEQVENIIGLSFKILYESNPNRIGWELHTLDVNEDIKNVKFKDTLPTNVYYLYQCYMDLLGEELLEELWNINEGFSMWVETFESGHTSINNMLNVYTIENLESKIQKYEPIVQKAWQIRCNWIETVKL